MLERKGKLGLGTAYIAGFKWGLEHGFDFLMDYDTQALVLIDVAKGQFFEVQTFEGSIHDGEVSVGYFPQKMGTPPHQDGVKGRQAPRVGPLRDIADPAGDLLRIHRQHIMPFNL